MICHQNEIEENEDKIEKEKEMELNEMKDIEDKEQQDKRKEIRSKNDKLRKLNRYDKIFENSSF